MLTDEQRKVLEEAQSGSFVTDDIITITGEDTVLDISNQGAASQTYQIDSIDLSGISTITLPSMGSSCYTGSGATVGYTGGNYTISGGGYTTTSASGISWSTISPSTATVNIDNKGIDIKEGGDIKVNGRSLSEFMTKMEQRLSILVPDPEKLEKFEALKKAYEHYKTMEALCFPEKEEEDK